MDIRKVGIPFSFFALLLVRMGGGAGEQDRMYALRKIYFPNGPHLPRGVCATGVTAQSKSDFSAIVLAMFNFSDTIIVP